MEALKYSSTMEKGEAGIVSTPSSALVGERSPIVSPSTTASSKTLFSQRAELHSPHWAKNVRIKLRSSWSKMRKQIIYTKRNTAHPIIRKLTSCPRGYPNVAAFLDSDESFMIYRRFGFLQSRLLLEKQDELRQLEKKLDRLDQREAKRDVRHPMTRDLREEQLKPRKELLTAIEEKFCSYVNLLDAAQNIVAMHRPAKKDYTSVRNYMYNNTPLLGTEATWIDHEEDLITLRSGREHAWLDTGIEKFLRFFHCSLLQNIFGDERSRQKTPDPNLVYYPRKQITRFANCIITIMILALLIVPIYVLYHLINDVHTDKAYAISMGVLVIATLAFSAVLSLFTKAKRHEILAAAAAYCAVLVVFLGNVGPNGPSTT